MPNKQDEAVEPFCHQFDPKKIKIKRLPNRSLENGTVDIDDNVSDEQIKNIKTTD